MKNPWFRMYGDFINNPKVQIVTEALRYRYVALLCLHCNADYENRPDDEIALSLRVTLEEWIFTRNEFVKRELLTPDFKIFGWEKKQYISDLNDSSSAERQKRYRDKKRNATVTSRLPEADTDTEVDKKESKKVALPDWMPLAEWQGFKEMRNKIKKPMTNRAVELAIGKLEKFKQAGHDPTDILNQSILNNYQDLYEPKGTHANASKHTPKESRWATEGQRLAAKYRQNAEREEQIAISGNAEPALCIAETIR